MLAAMIDSGRLFAVIGAPIDAHAHKAAFPDIFPKSVVLLLATTLQRGRHIELGPLRQAHDLVDDFIGGLRADGNVASRAIWLTQPGVQDAQIIVNLGY